MVKKSCFDACSTCNLHTTGRWVPRSPSSPPGYRLNYSLWASLGLSGPPPTSSSHYGLCDDVMANLGLGPRPLYEWEADACELPRFDVAHACAVLEGKQVVVAGDSTAGQLFLSLVMQLGGRFGRNSRHTSAISDLSASACSGATRLVFVRNDLLLWSTHRSEFNRARECDKLLKADGYVQRAECVMQRAVRDADYLGAAPARSRCPPGPPWPGLARGRARMDPSEIPGIDIRKQGVFCPNEPHPGLPRIFSI